MRISELDWDDYRIEHIAEHDVTPSEVWEAYQDPNHLAHRQGKNRYRLFGQTIEGRYLFLVLEHVVGTRYKPITAREMENAEKQALRRLRK
jgi:uncharacterized protein